MLHPDSVNDVETTRNCPKANITLLLMIRSSGDRDLDLDDDSAQSPFCEMKRAAESERASKVVYLNALASPLPGTKHL